MLKLVFVSCLLAVVLGRHMPYEDNNADNLIVGGNDTDITKAPYQISLHIFDEFQCGGSIVAPSFVVTAAHCVDDDEPQWLKIRAGSSKAESGGVLVKVKNLYIHPNYAPYRINKDVAVLELETPLTFSDKIKPIPLATVEPTKGLGQTSGWGTLKEDSGDFPEVLQSVKVPFVDRETCNEAYKSYRTEITEFMLCAGGNGKDSCQGDSGGPLVVDGKLAGIVSFGVGCAREGIPGVYTNIAAGEITSFIKNHTKI